MRIRGRTTAGLALCLALMSPLAGPVAATPASPAASQTAAASAAAAPPSASTAGPTAAARPSASTATLLAAGSTVAPFAYYSPLPSGRVGVTRPVLSIHVVLQEGADPGGFEYTLTLDGAKVDADFDGQFITYRAPVLSPGVHRATARLALMGWSQNLSWTFEVRPETGTAPPPAPLEELARRAVNGYRSLAGVDPLSQDSALALAAQSHARFFVTNVNRYGGVSLAVHDETMGWDGFTGEEPSDRAAYWGYSGNAVEDMAFARDTVSAVDTWMDSVYHRFSLLDSTLLAMGYAIEGSPAQNADFPATVLELGEWRNGGKDVPSSATIAYPVPNQTDVPLSFIAGEVPDPLSPFEGAEYPAGYPVTLQFPSLHTTAVELDTATLQTSDGTAVPAYVLAPDEASAQTAISHLGQAAAIIPKDPLKPLTTYRVHMAGRYRDDGGNVHPFDRTWTFRTARWDFPQAQSILRSWSGDVITGLRVTCLADVSRARVFVDGRPVVQLSHPTPTTLQFALPPGTYTSASVLTIQQPSGVEERWQGFLGAASATVPGQDPWQALDLTIGGKSYPKGAGLVGGQAFIPVGLLQSAGLGQTTLADGEIIWSGGNGRLVGATRMGDATAYLPDAGSGLVRVQLQVPLRVVNGVAYAPLAFVQKILRPIGQYARYDTAAKRAEVYPWLFDIKGHWAEREVRDLAARNVVNGFEDGLFHPSLAIRRGEFLKMLVAALGVPVRPGDAGGVKVPAGHWIVTQGWLGAAVAAGIVAPSDYPGGLRPDDAIPRLEMARLMERWLAAVGKMLPPAAEPAPFTDLGGLAKSDRDLVSALYAAKLLLGEPGPDGTLLFAPDRAMTRAEAAVVVERLIVLPRSGPSEEPSQPGASQ